MENILEFAIGAGLLITVVNMTSKPEEVIVKEEAFSASKHTLEERKLLAERSDFTDELREEYVPVEGGKYGELRPQHKWY